MRDMNFFNFDLKRLIKIFTNLNQKEKEGETLMEVKGSKTDSLSLSSAGDFSPQSSTLYYYTGGGSRRTPKEILRLMSSIARELEKRGYILRTGGSPGAEESFGSAVNNKIIYLPWYGFNKKKDGKHHISREAYDIARKFHPAWYACNISIRRLLAMNVHQLLGDNCDEPSKFLICWTPDGAENKITKDTGSTSQLIRIAVGYGIPIYNFRNKDSIDRFQEEIFRKL